MWCPEVAHLGALVALPRTIALELKYIKLPREPQDASRSGLRELFLLEEAPRSRTDIAERIAIGDF
jgi:hypothetical protein